ncbi:MAG: POTRA domain-containing protein [Betaproteobacteria bacterium]
MLMALAGLAPVAPGAWAQGLSPVALKGTQGDQAWSATRSAPAVVDVPAEQAPATRSSSVTITRFRFTGNTLFSSKMLAAVLASDVNRPMAYAELQALTEKLVDYYRAHGSLAIVVLPAQDISANKVTFVVVEAIPGKLPVEA